jgi:hypothetical protein
MTNPTISIKKYNGVNRCNSCGAKEHIYEIIAGQGILWNRLYLCEKHVEILKSLLTKILNNKFREVGSIELLSHIEITETK